MAVGGIGRRIRWVVEVHLGIKYSEFAKMIPTTKQLVSRWVNDKENPPSDRSLDRIAEIAGVSRAWLRYGIGSPTSVESVSASAEELFHVLEQIVEIASTTLATRSGSVATGSNDGLVFEVGRDGSVVRASQGWAETVHVPREAMVGAAWVDFFNQKDVDRVKWAVEAVRVSDVNAAEFFSRHENDVILHWKLSRKNDNVLATGEAVGAEDFSPRVVSY